MVFVSSFVFPFFVSKGKNLNCFYFKNLVAKFVYTTNGLLASGHLSSTLVELAFPARPLREKNKTELFSKISRPQGTYLKALTFLLRVKNVFWCQLRISLMMLYDDLFWIWNSRYRNTVQKYFGKCVGPKFSVITLNSGNSSVNKQKTESEKEKNGHTLGLTSTNSKVQITLNNITDSTHERVLQKKGELYSSPFPSLSNACHAG